MEKQSLWSENTFCTESPSQRGGGRGGRVNYGLDEAVCVELSPDY